MEISELKANSEDIDQMLHCVASDLGQHCLPTSHLWDARLIWAKNCLIIVPRSYLSHRIKKKMACVPSKDSDQPEHLTSLISLPFPMTANY